QSEAENLCCHEVQQVVRRIGQTEVPPTCMIDHPGFEANCLNPYTLQNIYNIYRSDYGPIRHRNSNKQFRHLAYRSFVSWCWGYLGRHVRVVIPSCVVARIRQEFPDQSGQYVGFRPPLD
ncbi:putative P2X purinoceptor 7-like, partial [Triplophysa rosa]